MASEQELAETRERKRVIFMHVGYAILPSPEKLHESKGSPGSDKTDTLRDFDLVKDWLTKSEFSNTAKLYNWDGTDTETLKDSVYYSFIRVSFSAAFDPMRNTASPVLDELVFWYYAGHGLSKEAAQKFPMHSSTPDLTEFVSPFSQADADEFVPDERKVKGGELCLHKVGFCDLYGLLKPWIAAVKAPSMKAEGSKKNKHLVIILDSCYSGIIAQELKDFEDKMNEKDPSFLQENSVTIQAACGPDQCALGGYFTPCFVYLNDPEKIELLNELKSKWNGMTEGKKHEYKSIELPSPILVSTIPLKDGNITMERKVETFNLTLFQDPGFFKFCSIKVYQHQDKSLFDGKDRVLSPNSADVFMTCRPFKVLDYKLKTYKGKPWPTDPNANTPMGLFLLKDRHKVDCAVCAHIHFDKLLVAQRINLVHHKKPPVGSAVYLQIPMNLPKVSVPIDVNAQDLVQACYQYVESKEPGRWNDVSQWDMEGHELGVNGLFRVQERQGQRSAWENSYLEHI